MQNTSNLMGLFYLNY